MKRILSIDGGGIRGIIPAVVLAEIENRTGKPVSQLFDLVAGTSTGGILALGLCKSDGSGNPQFSAEKLMELYTERGGEIFSRSFWHGVSSVAGLLEEVYPAEPLETVLKDYFGTDLLKNALKPVLISSYDIEHRQPFFFKSWREDENTVEMRLVARATSAAPTYFEPLKLALDTGEATLIDGGVFGYFRLCGSKEAVPARKRLSAIVAGDRRAYAAYSLRRGERLGKSGLGASDSQRRLRRGCRSGGLPDEAAFGRQLLQVPAGIDDGERRYGQCFQVEYARAAI